MCLELTLQHQAAHFVSYDYGAEYCFKHKSWKLGLPPSQKYFLDFPLFKGKLINVSH